jgi:protein-S-isoprenylcysteine O-methyltransferase Ste14
MTMNCSLLVLLVALVTMTEAFSIHRLPNLVRSFQEMQNSLLHVSTLHHDPLAVNAKERMSAPSKPSFMDEIENNLSSVLDNVTSKLSSIITFSPPETAANAVIRLIEEVKNATKLSSSWNPTSFIQDFTSQASAAVDHGMERADKMLDSAWMCDILPLKELVAVSCVFLIAYGLFGGLPILSQVFNFMLGPGLVALGSGTIVLGMDDARMIHPSPLSQPSSFEQTLVTEGIYSKIRHPIYAGTLAVLVGFSVVMGSAPSLVLVAALWYGLDRRTNFEEGQFMKEYGSEYARYKKNVPDKFLPKHVVCMLP